MSRIRAIEGAPAREIAEEAVHALRSAPIAAWGAYYLGTVPFCAVMVYFLNSMAISITAQRDLPVFAALLALLFAWMKTWQARYAAQVMALVQGEEAPAFGPGDFWRSLCRQTPRQAAGLVALPIALATIFFYVPVYSYFQNLTVLDGRGGEALGASARAEAMRWQKQAYVLVWMLSPMLVLIATGMAWLSPAIVLLYGTAPSILWQVAANGLAFLTYACSPVSAVLWINLAAGATFLGMLLKTYFDIDTIFVWAPDAAMNQGLLIGIAAACYLIMDPVMKAAYVVRCHRGISLHNGDDLRAQLRRAAATLAIVLALFVALPAAAEDAPPPPGDALSAAINQALDEELAREVYVWRGSEQLELEKGWIRSQVDRLSQWFDDRIEAFQKWLRRSMEERSATDPNESGFELFSMEFLSILGHIMLVLLLGALVLIALRVLAQQWKLYRQETAQLEDAVVEVPVELEDEGALADALPEEGWLDMANTLYGRGEFRLAMRAVFLATLSALAERRFINIVRHKSNAEYLREVRLRCAPDIAAAITHGTGLYEGVWYGRHPATPDGYAAMRLAHEKVSAP